MLVSIAGLHRSYLLLDASRRRAQARGDVTASRELALRQCTLLDDLLSHLSELGVDVVQLGSPRVLQVFSEWDALDVNDLVSRLGAK